MKPKPPAKQAVPGAPAVAKHKEKPASKWTSAKRVKVFGSALLLVSFGMQMYQTRAATAETEKTQAAELDGRSAIKALAYENLYFAEKVATGQEDGFNLYAAAMERTVGRLGMMTNSNEPKDAVAGTFGTLQNKAKAVHDLESFNQFMLLLKDQQDSLNSNELNDLRDSSTRATRLWWFYVILYVTGSLCVLRSQYLE